MVNLLIANEGARKHSRRIGRGPGSGRGKTSGRGHKGAGQRSGKEHDSRFEGGQMPYYRRIPKRGFKNISRKVYTPVNLKDLNIYKKGDIVDTVRLLKDKIIRKKTLVKILAGGDIEVAITVKAHAFSKKAKELIEAKGGKAEVINA